MPVWTVARGMGSPRQAGGGGLARVPNLEVRPGEQARLVKTVNIQVTWAAAHPGQDRQLPRVATHSRLQRATSVRSRVGLVLEDGSGSLSTGSPAGRTPPHGDGSMNMLRPPIRALPSVIVDTEKVLWENGWARRNVTPQKSVRFGWKGVRSGVRLESRTVRAGEEPEEHKCSQKFVHPW